MYDSVQHFDPFLEGKHMTLIIDLTPSLAWSLSTLIVKGEGGEGGGGGGVPCVNGTLVVLVLDMAWRFKSARKINKILAFSLFLQSENNSPALKIINLVPCILHALPYPLLRGDSLDCRRHFTLWCQI